MRFAARVFVTLLTLAVMLPVTSSAMSEGGHSLSVDNVVELVREIPAGPAIFAGIDRGHLDRVIVRSYLPRMVYLSDVETRKRDKRQTRWRKLYRDLGLDLDTIEHGLEVSDRTRRRYERVRADSMYRPALLGLAVMQGTLPVDRIEDFREGTDGQLVMLE